jgi:hypothetical protein
MRTHLVFNHSSHLLGCEIILLIRPIGEFVCTHTRKIYTRVHINLYVYTTTRVCMRFIEGYCACFYFGAQPRVYLCVLLADTAHDFLLQMH